MTHLKSIPDWKLAALYALMYVVGTEMMLAVFGFLSFFVSGERYFMGTLGALVVSSVFLWAIIIACTAILKNHFVMKDAEHIAKLAAIFYAVVEVLILLKGFWVTADWIPVVPNYSLMIVRSVVTLLLFYFLVRRHLPLKKHVKA